MSGFANAWIGVLPVAAQLVTAPALPGQAQRTVRVPDRISCEACTIEVIPRGNLEQAVEAGDLTSHVRSAVALPDGGFLVTQFSPKLGVPLRFDASGQYRGPIARSGEGPLEFRYASHAAPFRGDSVLVMDEALRRVCVLSPTATVARSLHAPELARSLDVASFPDGRIVATVNRLTRQAVGEPLHVFSPELLKVKSFGAEPKANGPSFMTGFTHHVTVAADGTIWAALVTSYVLEKWTREGLLLLKLGRDASWFGPHWAGVPTEPLVPPPALVQLIREDSLGLLWVFTSIPDKNWRSAFGSPRTTPRRQGRGGTMYPLERADKYSDTMIEVIDVKRAVVVARRRIDEVVNALYGTDLGVATGAGPDAEATLLLAFRLRGAPKQPK